MNSTARKSNLKHRTRILRDTTVHQVLVSLLNDYRSAEMMLAVRALWDLKRKHPTDVVAAYEAKQAAEAASVAILPEAERPGAERRTIHFQRRLVSQFYQLLGGLYFLAVVPKDVFFTHWERRDLQIIPEILLPIEMAQAKVTWGTGADASPSGMRMRKLFDDAPLGGAAPASTYA